jgi:hypothetical protein
MRMNTVRPEVFSPSDMFCRGLVDRRSSLGASRIKLTGEPDAVVDRSRVMDDTIYDMMRTSITHINIISIIIFHGMSIKFLDDCIHPSAAKTRNRRQDRRQRDVTLQRKHTDTHRFEEPTTI